MNTTQVAETIEESNVPAVASREQRPRLPAAVRIFLLHVAERAVALLLVAAASQRVEVLEGKTQRIHAIVAGATQGLAAVCLQRLAQRGCPALQSLGRLFQRGNVGRRRRGRDAEDVVQDEQAALHGRCTVGIGGGGQEGPLRQDAAPLVAGDVRVRVREHPNAIERYEAMWRFGQASWVRQGWAATANLLVHAEAFEAVGGFDPTGIAPIAEHRASGTRTHSWRSRMVAERHRFWQGWVMPVLEPAEVLDNAIRSHS